MSIGQIIQNTRESLGKTRREVVDNLGISESYLFLIETGKKQPKIPTNADGLLDIGRSIYHKILTKRLDKTPRESGGLILDWKFSELGLFDPVLKEIVKDSINGNLSDEDKRAIEAIYKGLKLVSKTKETQIEQERES